MIVILALTLVAIGMIVFLVVNLLNSHEKLGSRISGIWTNSDQSIRIMIYDIDSIFKAEIVWATNGKENLLGMPILSDLRLRSFNSAEGFYLCPFSQKKYSLKLKPASAKALVFHLRDEDANKTLHAQKWYQVKH
jgi:hypothetical protein